MKAPLFAKSFKGNIAPNTLLTKTLYNFRSRVQKNIRFSILKILQTNFRLQKPIQK